MIEALPVRRTATQERSHQTCDETLFAHCPPATGTQHHFRTLSVSQYTRLPPVVISTGSPSVETRHCRVSLRPSRKSVGERDRETWQCHVSTSTFPRGYVFLLPDIPA